MPLCDDSTVVSGALTARPLKDMQFVFVSLWHNNTYRKHTKVENTRDKISANLITAASHCSRK